MLLRIIKITISILLIWVVIRNIDSSAFLSSFRNSNKSLLLLAFILIALDNLLLSVYKWKKILRVYQIDIPLLILSKSYWVGMFFNMFMPGATGGDLVKAYDISKLSQSGLKPYVSVLIERVTGLLGIFANIFIGLIVAYRFNVKIDNRVFYACFLLFMLFVFMIWLIYNKEFIKRIPLQQWISKKLNIEKKLKEIYESIYVFKNRKKLIAYIIVLSLIFHFVAVVIAYIIALAIGINISFLYFWVFVPLISGITLMPISINGIGVRDITYITCFGQVGVSSSSAFSLSLTVFGTVLLLSSFGGIIYAFRK